MMEAVHTPPLGFALLTPLYDRVISLMTREGAWRTRLIELVAPRNGNVILDVGSGTGSLAIALTAAAPHCRVTGVDPDNAATALARRKAIVAGSHAIFEQGSFNPTATNNMGSVDTITCSLVLHQVPLIEKRRLIDAMLKQLRPGGRLFIADYGLQSNWIMRLAFRLTVQVLDGKTDTQPNADGILPLLIKQAGFTRLKHLDSFATPTGRIDIIRAEKPRRPANK